MGRYLNPATRLVFSIKFLKSLPILLASPTGPMATPIQMTKLVALLYMIRIGHYDS